MPKSHPHSFNNLQTAFGAALRRHREKLDITQQELGSRADMQRTYIADVERGRRNLSLASVARLAEALDVPLNKFFAAIDKQMREAPPPARAAKKRR